MSGDLSTPARKGQEPESVRYARGIMARPAAKFATPHTVGPLEDAIARLLDIINASQHDGPEWYIDHIQATQRRLLTDLVAEWDRRHGGTMSSSIATDARALLRGEMPTKRKVWGAGPVLENRVRQLGETELPELSKDLLSDLYPDRKGDDQHDAEWNRLSLTERALTDLMADIMDDCQSLGEVANPRYRQELRFAQRRSLEYLLDSWAASQR